MIKEDYVSFETAKFLKEKGFNEECISVYHDEELQLVSSLGIFCADSEQILTYTNSQCNWSPIMITAPTLQMAMKWLRKVHKIHISIGYTFKADANISDDYLSYCFSVENAKTFFSHSQDEWYNTYEESCEAAIKYCLENLI